MSTQTRSGGGGGGRNKSKVSKENKENAGTDEQQQQQQQQPLQQQKGNATNNSGGGGGDKQKKGTDTSAAKGGESKDKQSATHTAKAKQPTAEQMRIAQITYIKSGMDDPKIQEKIQKLMETTQRSEEEVCCALQECDSELDRAVIFLLETLPVGAFATTSKKKKSKSQSKEQNDAALGDSDWDNGGGNAGSGSTGGGANADLKERRGNRGGNNQRSGGGPGGAAPGRGGRGNFREGDRGGERDRNGFDRGGRGPRGRDGREGGPTRGSYGGGSRGGRGGGPRVGTRGPGSRDQNRGSRMNDHQEIDAWDPVSTSTANDLNKPEESSAFTDTWGDWDNEEYTGSLSDTKVFTPSMQAAAATQQPQQQQQQQQTTSQLPSTQSQTPPQTQSQPPPHSQQQPQATTQSATVSSSVTNPTELSAPPGLEQQILNPPQPKETDLVQQYSTTVVSSTATAAAAASNTVQYPDLHAAPSATQHLRQTIEIPPINSSSSLSAEQSQYFNTLSSQNSNLQTNVNSYQPSTVQYPTTYGSSNCYSDQVTSSQQAPVARRQRARVPPPSKIPSTAVEMPGDSLNNIGYLDVQFGGLDFGTDDTFDTVSVTDKFNANSLEQNTTSSVQLPAAVQPSQPEVTDYQTKPSVVSNLQPKTNLTSNIQSTQIIPGQSETLTATQTDSLSNSYSQRNTSTVVPSSVSTGVNVNSINNNTTPTLEQLTKTDPYNQSTGTNAGPGGYQNVSYSSSQANKTSSYPSSAAPQGYNNSSYSSTQVSTNAYPASSNNYSSYNQSGVNSYQQPSSNVASSVVPNNSTSSVGVSTVNPSNPSLPANNVSNNSSSNTNTGYLSGQYPVSQTSSAFPSQQSYQNSSQNVYGNTGLSSNTGYSGSTSTSSGGQYSNFSSSKLKDTPVSTQFDSVASSTVPNNNNNGTNNNVSSSSSSLPNSSVVSTTSMSSPSLGLTNTKVTNSTAKSSSSSSGTGVVPNIPMVSPYIQPGVPFYQQPVYSYEDLQMMQQRMSHVPGYYDMNYQTPTSLSAAGVRDANLGSVAYSTMSDGRFTRTDNNSSPVSNVPSTMSQQTGSGGPMLNLPYAYFYGGNVMPGGFQYGTPAIYPQQMATNATSGGQFQKPAYNSGYGTSGYDTLSQTGQDYNKNPYPSSGVGQQSKGQTVTNPQSGGGSGSDIAPSMYGKSHVALNKVNSYEKQSFHSGTPPPYNIAGTQTAGATSGQPYGQHLYIPTIPTHHNINMHQAMHQDSNSSGQRPQSNSQGKTATKQGYSPSTYWTTQN